MSFFSRIKIKIGYIDAIKGALVSFFLFSIAVIFIPSGEMFSNQIETIFTVTAFLFAIISGFFISRLGDRFNLMRELVSAEDANFLSLYQMSRTFSKGFVDKMRELIDKYYITCYDIELTTSDFTYKKNSKYFLMMWDEIVKLGKKYDSNKYSSLTDLMKELEKNRNTSSAVAAEKITLGQWVVLFFLSGIVCFCIFYLKVDTFFSKSIVVMLSTVMMLVLFLIRDLQNLKLGGKALLEESGEEVMEFIGKKRYYNYHYIALGHVVVPNFVKSYRIGFHLPGADEKDWRIKIVNVK